MNRWALGTQLRGAGFTATWAAGMFWFVLALVSAPLAILFTLLIFTALVGLVLGVVGVVLPLSLVSGLWGHRSRKVAAASAVYGFAFVALFLGTAVGNSAPVATIPAVVFVVPGVMSILAFRELGSGIEPPRGTV